MSVEPRLMLSPHATIAATGVRRAGVEVPVRDAFVVAALSRGLDPGAVEQWAQGPNGPAVRAMHRAGMLQWRIDGVAHLEVLGPGEELAIPVQHMHAAPVSRFAVVHTDDGGWLMDSALSVWRARLTAQGLALLADGHVTGWLAGLLELSGMLAVSDAAAADWSLHDRLFVSRTRGTLPFLSTPARQRGIPPEPAVPTRSSDGAIPLPRPQGPETNEPSLWDATEGRRTVRDFAKRPVELHELGHLLWRTLRVVRVHDVDPDDERSYEGMWRPVPSGGAMHATDLWLFCAEVAGLPRGAYRYDPVMHAVVPVPSTAVTPTMWPAPVAAVITARHRRTAWKYEPIALSLELKDVGVQMMALQLNASAVGLHMIPLGSGSTREVAAQLGIDPYLDAPVGEFLLGPA